MDLENVEVFLKWLDNELAKNNLSDYQFARKAKMSHTVISKARKGKLPKWDACVSIARALRIDPVEVFRVAGLLPKIDEPSEELNRLKYACDALPEQYMAMATRIIKALPEESRN
jgi:hypothetical protein